MIRTLSAAALIAVGATIAYAQATNEAALNGRQEAMKAASNAVKGLTPMNKGEAPFDAAKAAAGFKAIGDNLAKAKANFPDNSKTGETDALPAVWEKKADFELRFDKIIADAKAAAGASTTEAAFKEQFKKVTSGCGGCHKEYRKPPAK